MAKLKLRLVKHAILGEQYMYRVERKFFGVWWPTTTYNVGYNHAQEIIKELVAKHKFCAKAEKSTVVETWSI
jgi:hypothetical protein